MSRRVVILQETLPHYRVPLLATIVAEAEGRGIHVQLLHGRASGARGARMNSGAIADALPVRNRYFPAPGPNGTLVWQSAFRRCLRADLVVVEQANRMLINYPLLALQGWGGPAIAFWGHGRNYQTRREAGGAERLKARLVTKPTWWFAYTGGVAEYLCGLGFPPARVTVVGNTIDIVALRESVQIAWRMGQRTVADRCLFLGSLYPDKRLDLLFRAADIVASARPSFELHIAGSGELEGQVRRFASRRPWVHYHGAVTGQDKAALLASAQLLLIPGLVGLVVLDSFAAGVPVVTMADSPHSPEIEYLKSGLNGQVVPSGTGVADYASAVLNLLQDPAKRDELSRGALAAASAYTLDGAACRFVDGLDGALRIARRGPGPCRE